MQDYYNEQKKKEATCFKNGLFIFINKKEYLVKFRKKLFVFFITVGITSTLFPLFIVYHQASSIIHDEVKSKIISVVLLAKKTINTNAIKQIDRQRQLRDSSALEELKANLIEIRETNQRKDIYVESVYVLKKNRETGTYNYLINIGPDREVSSSLIGLPYVYDTKILDDLQIASIGETFSSIKNGNWISAYAPLFDNEGNKTAIVGLDVRYKEIDLEFKKLLFFSLMAFLICIFISIILSYFLSKKFSNSLVKLYTAVKKMGKGDFKTRSLINSKDEFNELSTAFNSMVSGLEERERLKLGFSRYVSQYALEKILKMENPIHLEGERKKVTVMFTDIRGFTRMSENMQPEEVLKILNEYFSVMIEIIFLYGGTLDKFMGDGMMLEFGAPLEDQFQELNAVKAAIHMHIELENLSTKWENEGKKRLEMGIGIHTGLAVMGSIGSDLRMEYTAIGDAVNVTSRLEGISKTTCVPIIISETVYLKVKNSVRCKSCNKVKLHGRTEEVKIFSVDPFDNKSLINKKYCQSVKN